ncbi:uncharacterized protein HMPREF1541_08721 [Cyphellophora europaea CBS 101466]|uniref:Uncharacterized protein n=1 Tax=Cyphellophora europaea (strain CBS 101466) TaxID=1220924 RepID=W2RL70_CYPE1|nr:uncharacterized protein HMPREF1541_08721 [Cyphellophora europaea CBS 101466]ETN36443.1 hypothetical protein HMPREF1541_08721 [Cyphellophora europaea CBS 101466]
MRRYAEWLWERFHRLSERWRWLLPTRLCLLSRGMCTDCHHYPPRCTLDLPSSRNRHSDCSHHHLTIEWRTVYCDYYCDHWRLANGSDNGADECAHHQRNLGKPVLD